MDTITCGQCKEPKPLDEFYAQYQNPSCKVPRCKLCVTSNVRANRKKKQKKYRAYDKRRTKDPNRKQWRVEYQREWRKKNPLKYKARQQVGNALRDGRLVREPCESCGTKKNVQAHHEDYTKPLDVRWLCFKCHRAQHNHE